MNATSAPVVLAAFEDPDEVLEFAISLACRSRHASVSPPPSPDLTGGGTNRRLRRCMARRADDGSSTGAAAAEGASEGARMARRADDGSSTGAAAAEGASEGALALWCSGGSRRATKASSDASSFWSASALGVGSSAGCRVVDCVDHCRWRPGAFRETV